MSRFCEIVFCAPLHYRRHVCSSNLKHSPSRELPLTARKTVFSRLNYTKFKPLQKPINHYQPNYNNWKQWIIWRLKRQTRQLQLWPIRGWKYIRTLFRCSRSFCQKSPGKNWRFKGFNGIKRVVSNAILYIRHNILWYLHRLRSNCLI